MSTHSSDCVLSKAQKTLFAALRQTFSGFFCTARGLWLRPIAPVARAAKRNEGSNDVTLSCSVSLLFDSAACPLDYCSFWWSRAKAPQANFLQRYHHLSYRFHHDASCSAAVAAGSPWHVEQHSTSDENRSSCEKLGRYCACPAMRAQR